MILDWIIATYNYSPKQGYIGPARWCSMANEKNDQFKQMHSAQQGQITLVRWGEQPIFKYVQKDYFVEASFQVMDGVYERSLESIVTYILQNTVRLLLLYNHKCMLELILQLKKSVIKIQLVICELNVLLIFQHWMFVQRLLQVLNH